MSKHSFLDFLRPAKQQTRKHNGKSIKQRRRSKSRDVETKRGAVKDAAKRSHRREALGKAKRWDYTFVYVGNVSAIAFNFLSYRG